MEAVLAKILEKVEAISVEAAARDAALRKEAEARDAALRKEAEARDAALRKEAEARDAALRKEAEARNAALRAEFAALESPSAPSYASVGDEALAALSASRRIVEAAAPPGATAESAPVATPGDLARLRACTSVSALVAAITPLLRTARGFDESVAGDPGFTGASERMPWLVSLQAPLPASQLKQPELFATWVPFWRTLWILRVA